MPAPVLSQELPGIIEQRVLLLLGSQLWVKNLPAEAEERAGVNSLGILWRHKYKKVEINMPGHLSIVKTL